MILATVTYDVSSASVVDKEIPVGVFISCVHLGRKYQTARKYQGIYFMSGNDEGQISDCALVYRDHRDVHRTTRQTHSEVYMYIQVYTRTHVIYVYMCIHTYERVSKPHLDVQHLWDFLVFDQLAHPLCVLALQADKLNKQTNK